MNFAEFVEWTTKSVKMDASWYYENATLNVEDRVNAQYVNNLEPLLRSVKGTRIRFDTSRQSLISSSVVR